MKYKGRRLAKSRRGRKTGRKMRKIVRKLRVYARPDGQHKAQFTQVSQISRTADNAALYVNHCTNNNATGQDISQCPEYLQEAALWTMVRIRGVRITFYPVTCENSAGNRQINMVHMASWPNDASQYIQALTPSVTSMIQRKDYKCYSGKSFKIKRYYRLYKNYRSMRYVTLTKVDVRNALGTGTTNVVQDVATNTSLQPSGWMPIDNAYGVVDKGVTEIFIESINFSNGDNLGRLRVDWYVDFKDRRAV